MAEICTLSYRGQQSRFGIIHSASPSHRPALIHSVAQIVIEAYSCGLGICHDPPQVKLVGIHIKLNIKTVSASTRGIFNDARSFLLPFVLVEAVPVFLQSACVGSSMHFTRMP